MNPRKICWRIVENSRPCFAVRIVFLKVPLFQYSVERRNVESCGKADFLVVKGRILMLFHMSPKNTFQQLRALILNGARPFRRKTHTFSTQFYTGLWKTVENLLENLKSRLNELWKRIFNENY